MLLGLISLVGLCLRLVVSNQSFWLDEGASLMIARVPLVSLIDAVKPDFHPPLFYAFLHFWLPLAGRSEWLIRLPFILLATATIPATYLLCREILGKKTFVPAASALFLALNPLHIYYSQELRMYSLVTLFAVLSWLYLLRKNFFLTGIFNILSFFTFYGAIFNILSQVVYLVIKKPNKRDVIRLTLPILLSFLVWWPVFSIQLNNGGYLKDALPGWQTLSGTLTIKSLFLIPLKFIFGRISLSPDNMYYLTGGLLVFMFGFVSLRSYAIKKTHPVWIAFVTPLVLASFMSLKTPVLGYWRYIFLLPFFMILLSSGVYLLPKITKIGTIIWICGIFLFFNLYFWTNPRFHREDWRGLAGLISGSESQLLIAFPYKFAPLYFYDNDVIVIPMLDSAYSRIDISGKLDKTKKVYYLDYLADLTDPNRLGLKSLEALELHQTGVYNLNNLGQVYEFQPL